LRKAVPPNPVDFVESTGLAAVAYGPDSHEQMDDDFARNVWKMQNPISLVRGFKQYNAPGEAEVSAPLTSLTDGADLLLTGMNYEGFAATSRSITTFRWLRGIPSRRGPAVTSFQSCRRR
jgi:UDP:flavonoid glycosyltransferase YjiC (YdhE family)